MQTGAKPQLEDKAELTQRDPFSEESVSSTEEETVLPWLRLLWSRRRLLAKTAAVGFLVGTLLAFILPKSYVATTELMPPDNQSSSAMTMLAAFATKTGSAGGALGGVAGDLLGLKTSGALFVGILRSRTVEDRLVERFDLKKVYKEKLGEDARSKLEDNTSISEDRKSGIISIKVSDHDPKRAAAIAQTYVEELDRLVAIVSTSSARRERIFLEDRLKTVKQELDRSSKEFSQFSSKNTAIDIKEQGKAMVESAAILMGQLIAAESEMKGLEQIYTSNNVRVRSVQARITELRAQLEKMGGKGESSTEVTNASTSTDSFYPSIRKLPLLGVKYADLYRQTRIQEVVFETLTQEYELAKVQEAKEIPSVKVLDNAKIPEKKSFPPRLAIIFLSVFLALLGGTVFSFWDERWQSLDAKNPNKLFAQEVIQRVDSHMPWASPNGSRLQAASHRVWTRLVQRKDSRESSAYEEKL
jgi:uncharacterized protein involved in exopolysaccharide biosynthesis